MSERRREPEDEANTVRKGPYGPSRPRQSIDAAARDARRALAGLLATGPPWVDDEAAVRFRQLQERVDAGFAFATVWKPVAPEITLVRLCVGPAERRRAGCPTMGAHREAQLVRFVAVYARTPAPVDPRVLFVGPRSADLGRLPAVVEAAVGPRARLRDDRSRPRPSEVRWLLLRSTLAPQRASAVLRALARRALRSGLTRVAHRRGNAWTTWTLAFLAELAAAARATAERASAYRAAYDAVHERLSGAAGERALGGCRVDPRALARLAAADPYLSVPAIVRAGLARRRTARRYLDAVTRLGLGRNERQGRLRLVRVSALADALEPGDPAGPKRVQPTEPPRHRA
jgi:hypothetical protein